MNAVIGPGTGLLLVRPDHLGDVLLTLPAVAALRAALPDRSITYLTPAAVADAVLHSPHVDAVETLPFPSPTAPADPPGWRQVVADAAPRLRRRFQTAIVFRPRDPWSGALVAAAGIAVRVGFAHPETRPFLTDALPVPAGRHASDMALDLVAAALGRRPPVCDGPFFGTTHVEEREAEHVLAGLPSVGPSPIVLHPGSGWQLKNWPAERWALLAALLAARDGRMPLILWGPGEERLAQAVVRASGRTCVALPRALPLGVVAAMCRRSRAVVASDNGVLHLAALVGAPVVGLYGPFGPDLFAPLAPAHRYRVVRVDLPCSPCGTLVRPPCGAIREPACVTGISVADVAAAVGALVGGHGHRPSGARADHDPPGAAGHTPSSADADQSIRRS